MRLPVLLIPLLLMSCATVSVSPVKTADQKISVQRGVSWLTSEKDNTTCTAKAEVDGSTLVILINIQNKTNATLDFEEASVSSEVGYIDSTANKWTPFNVPTATEYLKSARNNARTAEIIAAVGVGLTAVSAGRRSSTYSGTFSGSTGGSYYSGDYGGTVTTYDPDLARQQMQQSQDNLSNMVKANRSNIQGLSEALLFSSEIAHNATYSGLLIATIPNMPDLRVSLEVAGESHSFIFRRDDYREILDPTRVPETGKFFMGLSFTPEAPIGLTFGRFTNSLGFFTDVRYGPADLGSYDESYSTYSSDGTADGMFSDSLYEYTGKSTAQVVEALVGTNYKVLPIVWANLGVGITHRDEYRLFNEYWSNWDGSYDLEYTEWYTQAEPTSDVLLEAGLSTAIGPIYLAGSYTPLSRASQFVVKGGITF